MEEIICPECGSEDLYFAGRADVLDPMELEFERHLDPDTVEAWEYECQDCGDYFQRFMQRDTVEAF